MKPDRSLTRWTTLDSRAVRYRFLPPSGDRGAPTTVGLPLLLLHGLGCSSEAWGPSLRYLERVGLTQAVLAPDMPGYGRSPGPPETLGMEELADWAARFLDTLGIARAHVAGNSMGCQVALALARRHPGRLGSLVLAGPTTGDHFTPWWRSLVGLLLDGWREPLLYSGALLWMYAQMGPRRYLQTVAKMLADDPVAHAGTVTALSLIVRGERDAIIPDGDARRLAAALPAGRFIRVPGTAHAVQYSTPAVFTPMALAFLAGGEAGERRATGAPALLPVLPPGTGLVSQTHSSEGLRVTQGRSQDRGVDVAWGKVDGRRVRCRLLRPNEPGSSPSALGLPLLLLHGLAGSAEGWVRSMRCLERHGVAQPVIAPDLPGYGWSEGPPETMGMDALADWTVRLLDELEIPRAHIAAHSMGCQVALALARRHPTRVGSLVLAGPTMGTQLVPAWRYLGGLFRASREPLAYQLMALRMFAQMGVRRYVQTWAKMMEDDPLPEISSVTAPCLVVRGERDAIIPRAAAHQLAALLPRGAFLGVAGAGHVVQFNHAGAFTQILLAFLEGTEAVGGHRSPPDLRERSDEADHQHKVAGAAA